MENKRPFTISIKPYQGFLKKYLERIGVRIIKGYGHANILHDFSANYRSVFSNLKRIKPDLVILHRINIPKLAEKRFLYAYIPNLESEKDLGEQKLCVTNCPELMKFYLSSINLNFRIIRMSYNSRRCLKYYCKQLLSKYHKTYYQLKKQVEIIKDKLLLD